MVKCLAFNFKTLMLVNNFENKNLVKINTIEMRYDKNDQNSDVSEIN